MPDSVDGAAPAAETVSAPWLEVLPGARRFFAASFMTQLAMLGLFGFAGWLISTRLASQEASIAAQQHESEALRMKVEGLATDTQGLKVEMVNLRQSVASHTGEDVLFLKVLLLKPNIDKLPPPPSAPVKKVAAHPRSKAAARRR